MELNITSSTSKSRGPSNERKNVAATEKQLESMVYRLTQERGMWPFLTPRLENATEKTRENAPALVKQIWDFLEEQLEVAEKREMTVTSSSQLPTRSQLEDSGGSTLFLSS